MLAKYEAIINHPRHISTTRQPASKWSRAAQFSEFKALDGLDDYIIEAARLTDTWAVQCDEKMAELNEVLSTLPDREYQGVKLRVKYFRQDDRKEGGSFIEKTGEFKYYRMDTRSIVFVDGVEVMIDKIVEIEEIN